MSLTPVNNFSVVSLTPAFFLSMTLGKYYLFTGVNDKINSRISPRIFEKIQKGSDGILGGLGDTTVIHVKNLKSKISCQTPFK